MKEIKDQIDQDLYDLKVNQQSLYKAMKEILNPTTDNIELHGIEFLIDSYCYEIDLLTDRIQKNLKML